MADKAKQSVVRSARLELARVLPHSDLNAARLPIPPRPQVNRLGKRLLDHTRNCCKSENTKFMQAIACLFDARSKYAIREMLHQVRLQPNQDSVSQETPSDLARVQARNSRRLQ